MNHCDGIDALRLSVGTLPRHMFYIQHKNQNMHHNLITAVKSHVSVGVTSLQNNPAVIFHQNISN